ncbi:MAG: LCP family protein [Acidobacteriaceae bacterium]
MSKQRLLGIILIVVTLGGAIAALVLNYRWNQPLGPSLELPTNTPSSSSNNPVPGLTTDSIIAEPGSTQVLPGTQSAAGTQVANSGPYPTATSHPLCGGPATITILLIGSDQRGTGYLYGLADSIHIVRVDFTQPNLMVIDFPRDLWVEIPDIAAHHGITHGKLNQAYLYGNPGMGYYDGPGEGPGLLARTLNLNFGLRVDHYLALDTTTFVSMIDAVGGVDIRVTSPIDLSYGIDDPGPEYFLSIGTHHLDGKQALLLATNRIPSTFQRMEYQKLILTSLREKLLTRSMIPQLPKLVSQFIDFVQTDLSPRDINNLLCIAQAIPAENIRADSFPQEMFKASNTYDPDRKVYTFIYEVDFDQIRAMVADFMRGIWPFH